MIARTRLIARDDVRDALLAAGVLDGAPIERWGTAVGEARGGRRPIPAVAVPGAPFPLLVKSLRRGGVLGPLLRRAARVDRAFAEILVVESLRRAGVATPPIVAARLTRLFPASPWVSIELVTPYHPDATDLAAALSTRPVGRARTALLAAAGAAVRALHAHVVHEDLNLRNLLVRGDGAVEVLDLGDSRIRPARGPSAARNLARLYRSAAKLGFAPTDRVGPDVVRFARAYAPAGWKEVVRAASVTFRRGLPLHRLSWRLQGRRP